MTTTATAQTREWTLQECTSYAVENNLSVKRTEDNLHRQEIQLNSAQNAYLPSVNASVDQNFSFGRGLTADNTYSNTNTRSTSFNLGANINLFNGFQTKNNVELSKLNLAASTADLERLKMTSVFRLRNHTCKSFTIWKLRTLPVVKFRLIRRKWHVWRHL